MSHLRYKEMLAILRKDNIVHHWIAYLFSLNQEYLSFTQQTISKEIAGKDATNSTDISSSPKSVPGWLKWEEAIRSKMV